MTKNPAKYVAFATVYSVSHLFNVRLERLQVISMQKNLLLISRKPLYILNYLVEQLLLKEVLV